ncbi:MAG TPA: PhoH family protein [Candidatus Tumulicola sp.]
MTAQRSIELEGLPDRVRLFGQYDRNLSAIESALKVSLHADGDRLVVAGDAPDVERAERVVRRVLSAAVDGAHITPDDVRLAISDVRDHAHVHEEAPRTVLRTQRGAEIRPRTNGQREFVDSIQNNTLTIGVGPAGTGKTFLAVAMAVRALKNREVSRLILSRPAVEAGEKLGFLPGDFREKLDPYMRPLFDALGDLLEEGIVNRYLERGTLEIAPLAYMRGRTLSDAFVILDEAQNATSEQIKMFLTRLGAGSTMIVTGDATQVDLPHGDRSGLRDAANRLSGVEGVGIVELNESDVVRHPLVTKIIRAYQANAATR